MTFTTPTWHTPSGKVVHEQEIMKKYLPTFMRLYSLKHLLGQDDAQYIQHLSDTFQQTSMLPNAPRAYEWARDRLEWIKKKHKTGTEVILK